jgi:hypothetical protein
MAKAERVASVPDALSGSANAPVGVGVAGKPTLLKTP